MKNMTESYREFKSGLASEKEESVARGNLPKVSFVGSVLSVVLCFHAAKGISRMLEKKPDSKMLLF